LHKLESPGTAIAWSVLPLLALAGATDALMILHSKDLLAVYMTGNSTKLGDFLAQGAWFKVGEIASVIGTFVFATTVAAWMGDRIGRVRSGVLLLFVGMLLAIAAPLAAQATEKYSLATVMVIAAAMGTLNQVRADEPGVTFVTGLLVKLGRCLAAGKFGGAADAFSRWLCLLIGALLGTLVDGRLGAATLLLLAALAALGALTAWLVQPNGRPQES
jgi:uncharacterized membrane protein YoaK (UPF0700 family)